MYNRKAVKCYEGGRLFQQNGKLSGAERAYKKALKINPDFIEAHNELGNVFLDRGRYKEAFNSFRKALKLRPGHPMLLTNLGNVLQVQGELDKAIGWFNKAIEKDPKFVGAHNNLGNALRDLGRFREAVNSYRRALQINPELADTYYNLGALLIELGEVEDAVENYNKAIEINPRHKEAYDGLGNALSDQGEIDKAITAYRQAIEIDPRHKEAYYGLANALSAQGEMVKAIATYRKTIENNPRHKEAYIGLANALSDYGEIDEAFASYRKAIEINPGHAEVYRSLSRNKKFFEYDDDIRAMESLYVSESLPDAQKMHLAFGLGKAYEDLGEYEKSMQFILQATSLKRASFDYSISEAEDLFNNIKHTFSSEFFSDRRGLGSSDETPIFILGMPRSGTSLVEQILASHPEVFGAGELNDISVLTQKINSPREFPRSVYDLNSGALEEFGNRYIARIRKYSESSKYITDKMPQNFLYIGLIRTILPNARVICCIRDPMDNCLSLFKNYFIKAHYYTYDMTELGQYYNLYLDLMEHWRKTLTGLIYDQSYESLVADQEDQIRKLLDYCHLPWDDACLEFYKIRRNVRTASNAQVRRPIYKDSIKLWKRYEKQLEPLRAEIYG